MEKIVLVSRHRNRSLLKASLTKEKENKERIGHKHAKAALRPSGREMENGR